MKMIKKLSALFVLMFAFVALVGCAPKDPAEAKAKLEEAGYTVLVDGTALPAALRVFKVDGADTVVTATKTVDDATDSVFAVYFTSKDLAKAAVEGVQKYAENKGEKTDVKQSGQWVYYGTAQGVKDFE